MNLKATLQALDPVVSQDAAIFFLHREELREVAPPSQEKKEDREYIAAQIDHYQKAQQNTKTDLEHWHYLAKLAYWQMLERLHAAADITGPDNLPDVELPHLRGVMMDLISNLEKFGKEVFLLAAKADRLND